MTVTRDVRESPIWDGPDRLGRLRRVARTIAGLAAGWPTKSARATFSPRSWGRALPGLSRKDAERRFGAYWYGVDTALFAVRVLPDGFLFDGLNPACEAQTGLKDAKVRGQSPEDVLPSAVAKIFTAHYRDCVAQGGPITFPDVLETAVGRRHWETTLAPVRGKDGEIELLLGSTRDVTEHALIQAALVESEERFRRMAELVPDILFTASLEGLPDYLSPAFFAHTGLPTTTRGADALRAIHPDDVGRLSPDVDKARLRNLKTQVRIRRADGVYRWFLVRIGLGEGSAGPQLFGIAADIDEVTQSGEQIQALNERLSSVLSSISDCYYTVDRNWRMTSINPRAVEWFGRPQASLIGEDIRKRLTVKPDLRDAIVEAFATGKSSHVERTSVFYPGRWIELHVYPSPEGVSVFFRDITERRVAQAESEEATDLLQGSLDAMNAEIALLDDTGAIIAVNQAWRSGGAGDGETAHGVGAPYIDLCRRMIPELDEAKVARGLRSLLAGQRRTFGLAYIVTTAQGVRWRHLRINRFQHGRATRLIAMHEDVTEIARAQAQLRETSGRLLSIQEEERGRIAVELHDSTSQHLVALGLGVARLRRTLDTEAPIEPVLDDMAGSIGEALKEIRVLSYLLNPPNLERDGLVVTARRFVIGFGGRTGLNTAFRAEGKLEGLDPMIERAIFRVIQEALSNVHRHARAHGADVELTARGGQLVLRITDDGCGIGDLHMGPDTSAQLGVGIPGMCARVAQLGGALNIAGDESGTVVEALLPLKRSHQTTGARQRTTSAQASYRRVEPPLRPLERPSFRIEERSHEP